jgi:phospholipid/cholesterol/gamma-HCH transport system substrate-binding protein
MKERSIETAVGTFVLIGILCIGYMTVKLGKMEWFDSNNYAVFARFQSITGLKTGADVEMAGVNIGKVESITLDPEDQVAVVKIRIQKGVELTDDVIASVKTAGMIGDKYIMLSPGGSDIILKPGELITETESAVDLEELISKYVFGDV